MSPLFRPCASRYAPGHVMSDNTLNVLAVVGSLHRDSVTRLVLNHAAQELRRRGGVVDVLDLEAEPLPMYNPDTAYVTPAFSALQSRVDRADVLLLGTPDYHGGISSVLKNFLDHFWHEFAGKLFATIVASHERGLTVTDQLRTVARQCYAWTLPYGVSFSEATDVKDGRIASEPLRKRLEMMIRDAYVYGRLLADQRRRDLAGTEPGFLARHRK
jgi:NAD(P)H-dependent FMN reductase